MKDFMALYQNLVERCFNNCCNDFTSKALSSKEASQTRLLRSVLALNPRLLHRSTASTLAPTSS